MKGQCIAQIIYKKALTPQLKTKIDYEIGTPVSHTAAQQVSTPMCTPILQDTLTIPDDPIIDVVPFDDDKLDGTQSKISDAQIHHIQATNELPYQIYMSYDPFEATIEIEIGIQGQHATLGLITTIN